MSEILAHRLDGEEPERSTVVLLNGGMMSIAAWEPICRPFAEHYRVLRSDFRGQALSPGDPHGELEGNVTDVVALLDHLGIRRAHVVGASFGAEVGLLLAALEPERVSSLVTVTATDVVTRRMRKSGKPIRRVIGEILGGSEKDRGRFHDVLVEEVFSPTWVAEHRQELKERRVQIAQLPDAWLRALLGLLDCVEKVDLRPHLGKIECPTLVVVAGGDQAMPRKRSLALADALADAEVAELEGAGHALVAEDPKWLVDTCLSFLDRQSFLDHPLARDSEQIRWQS